MTREDEPKIKTGIEAKSEPNIELLISDLASKDKTVLARTRDQLIEAGKPALGYFVKALSNPDQKIRKQAGKILDEMEVRWPELANDEILDALVNDLNDNDGIARVRSREALVGIGKRSVRALSRALKDVSEVRRWEAAKALGQIGDKAAIGALIEALEDPVFDVRWLAAEGLIRIGEPSIIPLLRRLLEHTDSVWVREGVHHVFHDINDLKIRNILRPVLKALEDNDPSIKTPPAAETALNSLRKPEST